MKKQVTRTLISQKRDKDVESKKGVIRIRKLRMMRMRMKMNFNIKICFLVLFKFGQLSYTMHSNNIHTCMHAHTQCSQKQCNMLQHSNIIITKAIIM